MAEIPTYGRVYIDVPPFEPSAAGILAAADEAGTLITVADGAPAVRGFQYETDGLGPVAELNWTDCESTATLAAVGGMDVVQSLAPFVVQSGYECSLASMDVAEAREKSERRLIGGETVGVEKHLWNVNFPAALDITPTPGTPVKPKRALGIAAEYAGSVWRGVPMFHVGRRLAVFLAGENLISDLDDAALKGGGVLVSGAGYTGTAAPVGAAAPTVTQAWLYVTGRIVLVRDGIDTYEGVGPKNNNSIVISERRYVPAIEGVLAAILVDLT